MFPPRTAPAAASACSAPATWRGQLAAALWALWPALGLVAAPAGWAAPAAGAGPASAATLADCQATSHQRLLSPAAALPASGAAAVWLDATRVQWPGQPGLQPGERLRLALSAAGRLLAEPGQPLRGADTVLALRAGPAEATDPLSPALAARFAHLAPGLRGALVPREAARLGAALWRGQSLLLREDAAGRIVAVTALQSPGALDDRYARLAEGLTLGVTPPAPSGTTAGTTAATASGTAHTGFALWAPTARAVWLCLHDSPQSPAQRVPPLAWQAASGGWVAQLPGDWTGRYYTYLVDVFVPGTGWVRNRVTDPYAFSLSADGRHTWIGRPDTPATRPEAWAADRAPASVQAATDLVVYELHVRDFSRDDPSVPPAQRGKYTAFTHSDSHGMRHLRALAQAGLTDVHLLPVYDYGSVPERGCAQPAIESPAQRDSRAPQAAIEPSKEHDCYNWGYDPVHYSAPEGSFASNPDDGPGRVRELRQMVMALHRAGLRVGMDVVYNHTFAAGQHEKSVLDRIVPGYYHRLNARGEVERSTCCDNTATEHTMMARLMSDSVLLWAREHHIDSFRFDLMGHQPRAVMQAMQARLKCELGRDIHFIGEGWNFGEVADGRRFVQASQLSLNGSGIGTFSDRGRDALRGGGAGDSGPALVTRQGWLSGLHHTPNETVLAADAAAAAGATAPDHAAELRRAADLVRVGLAGTLRDYPLHTATGDTRPLSAIDYAGQPAGYASQPSEVVNYVENHDNQTLFDGLAMKLPRSLPSAERARIQTLGAAVVAFSQGVAYFHAGQDILRSKNLDRNSYNSGDWFNRVDWTGQTNHFGTGLPPEGDNGRDWPLMAPLLADPALAPTPADIAFARDAFRDLLKIRASTPLLRLRTADAVRQQLRLLNTGPQQVPSVLVGHLRPTPAQTAAGVAELAYFINVGPLAQTLALPELQGRDWQLHPVHLAPQAADPRPRQAQHEAGSPRFHIPPRTAVVWVRP